MGSEMCIRDRIEAGTFMFASAATCGDVVVRDVIPKHLESLSAKLIEVGCEVIEGDDWVRVISKGNLKSTNVKTLPYPGFPTDMQPQMAVVLALAHGTSMVTESIFENRFGVAGQLKKMGADISVDKNMAHVTGRSRLTGADVAGTDLRGTAALFVAALAADGESIIRNTQYINRGYEKFVSNYRELGAEIIEI